MSDVELPLAASGEPLPAASVDLPLAASVERRHIGGRAQTRRGMIGATLGVLGSAGIYGLAADPAAAHPTTGAGNSAEALAGIAATGEALATIFNTVGAELFVGDLDAVTLRNVRTAAQQEKSHYELFTSPMVGAKAATTLIYVPNDALASPAAFLSTLVAVEQVFINGYLLALTVFARQGTLAGSQFARYSAEILATEAVHRALALQSLGRLGNDRVYAKFAQAEPSPGLPTTGQAGFRQIGAAVTILESLGFGFGRPGSKPGTGYDYATVAARTPSDPGVNTLTIS